MKKLGLLFVGSVLSAGLSVHAYAEDAKCSTVRLADPGWSDIAVTNGIASLLLDGLGYKPQVMTLGVPIIFAGLQKNQVDVFLGNWMPAQQDNYDKFVANGEIEKVAENLAGTEFTLAVPTYMWEKGVKTFDDLGKHGDEFDKKIYGIAAGAPGNVIIQKMIDANESGLGGWKLIESSEQAMLVQVGRAVKRDQPVVFLGWTPHPMNVQYEMKYLKGGEDYFGESGAVNTLARKDYTSQCPNVAKLLTNLTFTQEMENSIMNEVLSNNVRNQDAVREWVKANPQAVEAWLDGVKTQDGEDGLAAVKAKL
ncbi:choline ABC transporter substrate-binding protein [Pseudomonas matsuisoli]|uniref:Glycine/betaine ABC transporter substrate-binding protein n=1 Tax=Pseudomonas matsuisoli TaxID=1515666 RepID=A0A917PWE5_9PSED|nr:choline ABC transporter substrate-binding protein [Pseudomonas matsuisoli]GGJ95066.1 glycine/betaine ABC transporter substrate-binding protein [Pseudomonas matsuisoli]